MINFNALLLLFVSTASAGWVQLCSSDGHCTDTGDANSNTCIGPVNGRPPFTFQAHGFKARSMAIFADKCWSQNVGDCGNCNSVSTHHRGPVWAVFHTEEG
ncbi:hypothetical protein VTN77DRAFT_2757 [Rasamsonia byssochlamydoides]|uniref:uncharacterized protein n=1 Tax=Rasamsonia byssochlamydoides TaxID=89139 RepID=UPI00374332F4